MISHEDPNDLIDSVTAEIEAIIQEEINSQNISAPIGVIAEPEVELETAKIDLDVVPGIAQEPVEVQVQNEIITENSKHSNLIETTGTVEATETSTDIPQASEESDTTNVKITVDEKKEEYVEYTVKISSPTQEEKLSASNEATETISPTFMTIESIINDAPIDEKDGPRVKHLKQALRKALNNTAKSCR